MSSSAPLIRLNQIYYNEQPKTLLAASWYFSVLGLTGEARKKLIARLLTILEAAYGDKNLVLDSRFYQSQGIRIKRAGQGFALSPEDFLILQMAQAPAKPPADLLLDFVLNLETILARELGVQVEMFKVLDLLVRLTLKDNRHGRFDCVTSGVRGTFETHAAKVREVWEQYLPPLLLDSPRRSGLTCPDLLSEILLEADFLTAFILLNILDHHPRSLNVPLKINFAGAIALSSAKQIDLALQVLVGRGLLTAYEEPRAVYPSARTYGRAGNRYYETVIMLGPAIKDLLNHPLPGF